MSLLATVLAQTQPEDSSSAAAAIFGVLLSIGLLSIFALTKTGRRTLLPLITVLIGGLIGVTTIADAQFSSPSVLTIMGLFFAVLLIAGGLGALREGLSLPEVEGVEPSIEPRTPRISPED